MVATELSPGLIMGRQIQFIDASRALVNILN